ncbi:MAG: hypothetical protein J6B10_05890 [Lachnospiraceae bacterium]|nr:hypothetical protein [Lachnospiraceae bacterium]
MDEEKKEALAALKRKLDFANKLRLAFMFIALVLLVLIFWGNKMFEGQAWFESFTQRSYVIATWDLLFMLIASVAKLMLAVRYNKLVKKM